MKNIYQQYPKNILTANYRECIRYVNFCRGWIVTRTSPGNTHYEYMGTTDPDATNDRPLMSNDVGRALEYMGWKISKDYSKDFTIPRNKRNNCYMIVKEASRKGHKSVKVAYATEETELDVLWRFAAEIYRECYVAEQKEMRIRQAYETTRVLADELFAYKRVNATVRNELKGSTTNALNHMESMKLQTKNTPDALNALIKAENRFFNKTQPRRKN